MAALAPSTAKTNVPTISTANSRVSELCLRAPIIAAYRCGHDTRSGRRFMECPCRPRRSGRARLLRQFLSLLRPLLAHFLNFFRRRWVSDHSLVEIRPLHLQGVLPCLDIVPQVGAPNQLLRFPLQKVHDQRSLRVVLHDEVVVVKCPRSVPEDRLAAPSAPV